MTVSTKKISPCLWFDNRIEEAVNFYVSVFGGKILDTTLLQRRRAAAEGHRADHDVHAAR